LKLKWRYEVGAPVQSTPTVIGDTLFFGAWNGQYHALETQSGEPRWKFDAGIEPDRRWGLKDMRSTADYNSGHLFFGTGEGDLHCVDGTTGKALWKTRVDPDPNTNISSSPTVYQDRVFVGTSGNRAQIACLDRETGAVRWRFYIVPDRLDGGGSVWTSAAIDEEQKIVYNVTGNPRSFTPPGPLLYTDAIIANDLETGELLWHYQVRATDPFDLDFSCHPMLFEAASPGKRGAKRQCVGAGNKTAFFTWDRYTGELLWRAMLTERDPITSRSAGLSESVTAALHAYTGEIVWWRHNESMNRAPVAVANGVFYHSLANGNVEAFDAETGKLLWQTTLPSPPRGGVAIANGTLYASNGEGGLPTNPKNSYYIDAYSVDGR
jgi:polyvinyl alcohol dehydrogenase (cytochrome)